MKNYLFLCVVFLCLTKAFAQLDPNFLGNAYSGGGDCYVITSNTQGQLGAVWYDNAIDFTADFEIIFDANFGANDDDGADGITLVMKNNPTYEVGQQGNGLGYAGIMSSIAVEFDTYQNSERGDLASDHIALISNGSTFHSAASNLAGPVSALSTNPNIEDDQFHEIKIAWVAASQTLTVLFDCEERITYTGDLVNTAFNGTSQIYFGFTGSTGLYHNLQQICFKYLSFADTQDVLDAEICSGDVIDTVDVTYNGAVSYLWSPSEGVSDVFLPDPEFSPAVDTVYSVDIIDSCGDTVTKSFSVLVNEVSIDDVQAVIPTICQGDNAEFTITGTPNAEVTYNINGGADETVVLDASGNALVLISNVSSNQTINVTYIESTENSSCSATLLESATVSVASSEDASFTYSATCDGGTANVTGDLGGVFQFNPQPSDGALLDEATGEIINAQPNTSYSVEYTTSGSCPDSSIQTVTTLDAGNASFVLVPETCGAVAEILGDLGGVFSFDNQPTDGALINPDTGEITNGVLGTTYTIAYTTSGACPQTEYASVTIENCIIPEVITPNEDGYNDRFDLTGFNVKAIEIFNRYGTKVFDKSNGYVNEFYGVSSGGHKLPTGTYFYTLVFQDNSTKMGWVYVNREK
ncbi:gliding motility-associated C-terminal domain-containing protein [Winogradskyella sp. SYSU M77433]|uniref:lectin-like domain-containing protein n=1 Tax=Winogradskyella sp. SYSU M77433 TaxID=3042722 RepID=UPI00248109FE|nr:gliding motility-associated C-terminal domain-containing protein [Winogradskyella sp. SYSU M77433]MDH7911265.1 gliding motility-associated C-terminal domain-containing protein [Winogradskyella sp. SYSU M77433]